MTDKQLDELMKRLLMDAIKNEYDFTEEEVTYFNPSPKYKRQMTAMLNNPQKWINKYSKPAWKKVLQQIAVFFLIVSLGLGGLMLASPTVRATVVRWVVEWYETHITYRYSGETIENEMPQYIITDLPDGYVEENTQKITWENYVRSTYVNKETNGIMYFDYVYMQQGSEWDYDVEDVQCIPVTVNGMEGQLFAVDDWEEKWNTITWIDSENNIQFSVDANLSQNDILHIAESVSLVE